jgi:hypothetical protein
MKKLISNGLFVLYLIAALGISISAHAAEVALFGTKRLTRPMIWHRRRRKIVCQLPALPLRCVHAIQSPQGYWLDGPADQKENLLFTTEKLAP